jgi:putative RNA 2'-phosphotransferase
MFKRLNRLHVKKMKNQHIKMSKFLSFVLRHRPERIGLTLDQAGWASIEELIRLSSAAGRHFTRELIAEVMATNDKQRFALSPDGQRIRANQGHSIAIDFGLKPLDPPHVLYHGTATRFLGSILAHGLRPGKRPYVHLSSGETTALKVGQRHGKPIVLLVDSGTMNARGHLFYRSENEIWLTKQVPPEYLKVLN